ncbi:MAG: hypothetical protein NT001_05565 [Candidatus Woesearchaeota archaeon]|nr:hypothetical protein [Candidatus Woesearchaeota archaeon]
MKLINILAAALIGAKLLSADPVMAQQPAETAKQEQPGSRITLAERTDFLSRFNFRGYRYSDDYVIQLNPSAAYGNTSLIGFMNYDSATGKFNEIDATLDFTRQFGHLSMSAGYTYLHFPNTESKDSQEVYASASLLDNMLNPTFAVFHDFADVRGDYIPFSISHTFETSKQPITVAGKLVYNNHFLRQGSGLSNWEASVAMPVSLSPKTTVTSSLNYTHALDRADFEDFVYFGVSVNGSVEHGKD